ncbi:MAG: Potassium-transporting ATPase KdpC subunit [Candidatus Erwinia impunctatus]|nr:Potassium-transporting ATPase KdpC subunit [Culicoides impunctatus]
MSLLRPAILLLVLLTAVTGVGYPLLVTGVSGSLFPSQAEGTRVNLDGEVRGSLLIGQNFERAEYFHGRPSATSGVPYNAQLSSGSNLAVSNPDLDHQIEGRVSALRKENPGASATVPVELVTTSASGLDPDISVSAALWQIPRIAAARKIPASEIEKLVEDTTATPMLHFMGLPVVNVLALNLALDALTSPGERVH